MPIPDFVIEMRKMIGNHPMWLSGSTAVILKGDEVLLIKRADNGQWAPVTGIIDPGEEAADTAIREAMEEAGIVIEVERLASISTMGMLTYPNGDQAQYIDHNFRCRYVSGEPRADEEETTDARWFPLDDLPEMPKHFSDRIESALAETGPAEFRTTLQ